MWLRPAGMRREGFVILMGWAGCSRNDSSEAGDEEGEHKSYSANHDFCF